MPNAALIKSRVKLAKAMIKKLKKQVKFTPANRGAALVTDKFGLTKHGDKTADVYDAWDDADDDYQHNVLDTEEQVHATVLANTVSKAHGNCDMKSLAVFNMIRNSPAYPAANANTKVLRASVGSAGNYGHSFCLICSQNIATAVGTQYNIDHFGDEAVVCDGWQSDYYAPNVDWPYGRVPGVEAFVWRKLVTCRPITVDNVHSFHL